MAAMRLVLVLLYLAGLVVAARGGPFKLEAGNGKFEIEGEGEWRIRSGSVHYWRVHKEKHASVLASAKAMGLNTIDTYVPWFLHQPTANETFDFDGPLLDLGAFLDAAHAEGLHVLLRVGPYVCAEADLGGLPSWLLADEKMRLRSTHPAFLSAVRTFWNELIPKHVVPRLSTRGGPIVAVQVENEFGNHEGALRKDGTPDPEGQAYLEALRSMLVDDHGVDVLLFTSDGASVAQQVAGGFADKSKGVIRSVNFGPHVVDASADECLAVLDAVQGPEVPKLVTELWVGWFDHWGERHHVVPSELLLEPLKHLVDRGASFNLYMFHGGTNFGLTNGANYIRSYYPTTSSYDYDAPLDEAARRTPKFDALAKVILGAAPPPPEGAERSTQPLRAYGDVRLQYKIALLDCPEVWPRAVRSKRPLAQEAIGQRHGWTLYRMTVPETTRGILEVSDMRDRMQMWVLGSNSSGTYDTSALHTHVLKTGGMTEHDELTLSEKVTLPDERTIGRTVDRQDDRDRATGRPTSRLQLGLNVPRGGGKLELFVENMGRVNMGAPNRMQEPKGISRSVKLHRRSVKEMDVVPFEMSGAYVRSLASASCWRAEGEYLSENRPTPPLPDDGQGAPALYRGSLVIAPGDVIGDTYLNLAGWRRGMAYVNGFALGRYWERGPLVSLFVPAGVLHEGQNEVVVFELHAHIDNPSSDETYVRRTSSHPRKVDFTASPVERGSSRASASASSSSSSAAKREEL